MALKDLAERYTKNGLQMRVLNGKLIAEIEGQSIEITTDEDLESAAEQYYKSKDYEFDNNGKYLVSSKEIEFHVIRLDEGYISRPDHEFLDKKGNSVKLSQGSTIFSIALLDSDDGARAARVATRRIKTRISRNQGNRIQPKISLDTLLLSPQTISFTSKRKVNKEELIEVGKTKIKSTLFKLAYHDSECWELREVLKANGVRFSTPSEQYEKTIPTAKYNDDLISYYKVAKSSIYSDQEYLSYYHILEYFFLRVSDEILHTAIKAKINSPSFNSNYENINSLLAIAKKNDKSSDEKEMLKAVLKKYINEDELIEFIRGIEKDRGKIYTNKDKKAFGENVSISLQKDHALSNTTNTIKSIRNSLVHSSDKHNREECYLPLSEAEGIVSEYIPLIRFLAEKVIFATAE